MASAVSVLSYIIALAGIVLTLIGVVGSIEMPAPSEREPDGLRILRTILAFFASVAIALFGLNFVVHNSESALAASGLTALVLVLWLVALQVAIWKAKDGNAS